jgi:hypothetical protein
VCVWERESCVSPPPLLSLSSFLCFPSYTLCCNTDWLLGESNPNQSLSFAAHEIKENPNQSWDEHAKLSCVMALALPFMASSNKIMTKNFTTNVNTWLGDFVSETQNWPPPSPPLVGGGACCSLT